MKTYWSTRVLFEETRYSSWGQKSAAAVGCDDPGNIEDQIECLQQIDAITLVNSPVQVGYSGPQAVVDGMFSEKPFLSDHPKQLMQEGLYNKDTRILLGTNRFAKWIVW